MRPRDLSRTVKWTRLPDRDAPSLILRTAARAYINPREPSVCRIETGSIAFRASAGEA